MNYSEITDSMLSESAKRVRSAMLRALPEPEDCYHEFTHLFELKMQRLFNRYHRKRRFKRIVQSVAAVVVLVLLGSAIWLMMETDAYADFSKWLREVYEDSVIYRFFDHRDNLNNELPEYCFGWLPDGYELKRPEQVPREKVLAAYNDDNVVFLIYKIMDEDNSTYIFGDGMQSKKITVHGSDAVLYYDVFVDSGYSNTIVWMEGELTFTLSTTEDEKTAEKIANNVQPVN